MSPAFIAKTEITKERLSSLLTHTRTHSEMQENSQEAERSTLNDSDLGPLLAEPRIPGLRRVKTLDQSEISRMDQETSTSSIQED